MDEIFLFARYMMMPVQFSIMPLLCSPMQMGPLSSPRESADAPQDKDVRVLTVDSSCNQMKDLQPGQASATTWTLP